MGTTATKAILSELRIGTKCRVETLIKDSLFHVTPVSGAATRKQRAVVFVHGFLGNALNTWKDEEADESFPSLLRSDPELEDHDFFLFQYVTKDLNPPAIDNIVAQLKFAMSQHLNGTRIIFLAHSMGGLVSMRCILSLLEEGHSESISGLLLYGSPMTGVEWAKYAQLVLHLGTFKLPFLGLISRFLKTNKQVEALTSGSEFIERLNGSWILRVLNGGHPKAPAAQRAWFPVRVVSGNDDWVVKESSARGFYSEIDWINVNQDHRSLVKPRDPSEFTYQIARQFLKDCRMWIDPKALLKLRQQLDGIWDLHQQETIGDWQFELSFDAQAPDDGSFGVPGFHSFNVLKCSYRRKIPNSVLKFGFAIGHIAAGAIWDDDFVFLHSVRFGALPTSRSEPIRDQLRSLIRNPAQGWPRLFEKVYVRIRATNDNLWHQLHVGAPEFTNDGLIVPLSLPQEAASFVGQEAVVDITFRGLLPSIITDYTVEFPWLCDGFVTRITVNGEPSFLISSQGMRGSARIQTQRDQGMIEHSSEDLIFPASYILFEWGFDKRGIQ